MNKLIKKFLPLLALAPVMAAAPAVASDTSIFFNNTLYLQNQANLTSGGLWLNQDGSYVVYFNRGVQKIVPQSAAGPFQYEGREGTYHASINGNTAQICLTPDTSTAFTYNTEQAGEVFAGAGCYDVPALEVGKSTIATASNGKTYKFWLLQGR